MQSSGQYDNVESTALAKEDRADNSDVPKIQRESIRTRRERLPAFRESAFRAAVVRDGVPVADILQVWLGVSSHPARGEAQAEEIRHRVLAPIFEEKS
jgi:hypothetical protein